MMNNEPLLHIPQFDPDQLFVRPDQRPEHDSGHRTIWLNESIFPATTQKLVDALLRFESAARGEPIHLYIYSGGGCIVSGLAIINTMHHITSPVYTYAIGYAASMAAAILASGQRDHRYVLSGSFVMIHQASGGGGGTMDNLRATLAWQSKLEAECEGLLARACKRSEKDIQEASRVDNWMDAQEAKSFGLVDHILEPHPAKI